MAEKRHSFMGYMGAKEKQAPFMNPLFPKDFNTYLEIFGGTMKNFLNLDYKCKNIIYNDISYFQSNMMLAYSQPEKLLEAFRNEVVSVGGILYHKDLQSPSKNVEDLKKHYKSLAKTWGKQFANSKIKPQGKIIQVDWMAAVKYIFCLLHSYSGIPLHSFVYARKNNKGEYKQPFFLAEIKRLEKLIRSNPFKDVEFYNEDALTIADKYDSEKSFILADPGYVGKEFYYRNNGKKAKTTVNDLKFHIRLADKLRSAKSKWMVCYYYHPILEKLYPRSKYTWITNDYARSAANSSNSKRDNIELGDELIILNYGHELKKNKVYRNHLIQVAASKLPKNIGRRSRWSYSTEFKKYVVYLMDSGIFTKRELLRKLGIGSYATINRWLQNKTQFDNASYLIDKAKEYLHDKRKESQSVLQGIIAQLYHGGSSLTSISKKFNVDQSNIMSWYDEWKAKQVAVPRKQKIQRFLTYDYRMEQLSM